MLSEATTWWTRQMRDLSGIAQVAGKSANNALVIAPTESDPPMVAVIRRRNGRETSPLGRYPLDPPGLASMQRALRAAPRQGPVILRLPSQTLLETQVTLPLLAERDPARVLGYEMDRLTPFSASELYWSFAIERRDRAAGLLHLRLSLVPRQDVQPLLTTLARIGVVPVMLEIPRPSGEPRLIALSPTQRSGMPRLSAVLATVCAILGVVATVQPFAVQSLALAGTARELEELRPQIARIEEMRRRIAGQTNGADVIEAERGRIGDPIGILATITDILPDDAFLTTLTLARRKIALDGQAAGAARLIARLAADPTIRDPAFASPVTRTAGGRDRFSIHAEIGP